MQNKKLYQKMARQFVDTTPISTRQFIDIIEDAKIVLGESHAFVTELQSDFREYQKQLNF